MAEKKMNGVVPVWQKAAFGVGGMGDILMQNAANNMANQVLNISLGVNPALVSLAIFISRIWDAFTDPIMGAISDNTRTRFGRRRPFKVAGGLGGGLLFIALWRFPFVHTEMGYFYWFLGCSLMFSSSTFENRSFCLLMLVLILCCLGLFMVTQLGIYINIYYIYEGDKKAASTMLGIAGTTYHLMGGILASPVISFVAARIGKKKMLRLGLSASPLAAGPGRLGGGRP